MAFHVGQKVVCISEFANLSLGEIGPAKGRVLTIRTIHDGIERVGLTFLRFHEIVNSPLEYRSGLTEASFDARKFRPVVERKTDIAIFTAMLKTDKVPVP